MNEKEVTALKAQDAQNRSDYQSLLAIISRLKAKGIIVQIHYRQTGDVFEHEIHLINKPSTSVEIRKIIPTDRPEEDWEATDLTIHGN